MSSSSTYSGPDSTRGTDEFTRDVNGFFDLLAKRSKLLGALAVLVLVLAAVFAVIANQNEQKSDAGRSALYLAQKSLDTQLETIAKASAPVAAKDSKDAKDKKATPPVSAEAIQFRKLDVDTQLADSISKLKAVATDYAATRSGFDAMLLLGKTYLNHGNAAEAAEWFQKSTAHAPSTLDRAHRSRNRPHSGGTSPTVRRRRG